MSKVTDARIAAVKALFETGSKLEEDNFADLIDAIQEAAQEHEHVSAGGADSGTGNARPVVNLQSGTAAQKPESPAIGDIYVETDTSEVYACYAAGSWTEVGGVGDGAPTDASYVTLDAEDGLSAETRHRDITGDDLHDPKAHAASHQNGESDEISVAGLSGELADDQPPKAHGLGGSKHSSATLAELNALISDATLDDEGDSRDPPSGLVALFETCPASGWTELENVSPEVSQGAWQMGGNLSGVRDCLKGNGSQTAALATGEYNSDYDPLATTEEYDGTSWSAGGDLSQAREGHGAAGSQIAALAFGGANGSTYDSTEEYNGTSWSAGGDLITARINHADAGTQTAALAISGADASYTRIASTEEYDGTSWASGGNVSQSRTDSAGCGTQTAAIVFGGYIGGGTYLASTEHYDGTSWSSGGNLNTARDCLAGGGEQTAALAFGGGTGTDTETEKYDGSSWTQTTGLNQGRGCHAGAGGQTAALAAGGYGDDQLASTEEYNVTTYIYCKKD